MPPPGFYSDAAQIGDKVDDRSDTMLLNISQVGQIALPVLDVDRAEAGFEKVLGLRKLYRFGNLTFFDCAGVRLLLEKDQPSGNRDRLHLFSLRRYRARGCRAEKRGLAFDSTPRLIAKMDDHDLWMAFFRDPDGHTLAVMQEAPKGYAPPKAAD